MSLPLSADVFTFVLSGATTLAITADDAVRAITVYNPTADTTCTITGSAAVGGESSVAISLAEGESYNLVVPNEADVIGKLTIIGGEGGLVNITALK